jgi:hypothetical protein
MLPMKCHTALLICFCWCVTPPARGQDIHGTVIVSAHSKTKLVVAAESRNSDDPFSVDFCKIIVLDKRTAFAGAGIAVHANPIVTYWNAYAEAAYAFEKSQPNPTSHRLRDTATDFGKRFVRAVNKALQMDPHESQRLIEGNENRVFNAIFYGFANNIAEMYQIEVVYDPTTRLATESLDTFTQGDELRWGAAGRSETVVEVVSGASAFGRSELEKWEKTKETFPQKDRDVRWAMKLVELTIAYNPHREDVGGPIDSLEITANGIRWVQCKSKCQCNNKPLTIPINVRKMLESE